jgi:hypothetical protein
VDPNSESPDEFPVELVSVESHGIAAGTSAGETEGASGGAAAESPVTDAVDPSGSESDPSTPSEGETETSSDGLRDERGRFVVGNPNAFNAETAAAAGRLALGKPKPGRRLKQALETILEQQCPLNGAEGMTWREAFARQLMIQGMKNAAAARLIIENVDGRVPLPIRITPQNDEDDRESFGGFVLEVVPSRATTMPATPAGLPRAPENGNGNGHHP